MEQHDFPELAAIEKFLVALRDAPRDELDPIEMVAFGFLHQLYHLLCLIEQLELASESSLDS